MEIAEDEEVLQDLIVVVPARDSKAEERSLADLAVAEAVASGAEVVIEAEVGIEAVEEVSEVALVDQEADLEEDLEVVREVDQEVEGEEDEQS